MVKLFIWTIFDRAWQISLKAHFELISDWIFFFLSYAERGGERAPIVDSLPLMALISQDASQTGAGEVNMTTACYTRPSTLSVQKGSVSVIIYSSLEV